MAVAVAEFEHVVNTGAQCEPLGDDDKCACFGVSPICISHMRIGDLIGGAYRMPLGVATNRP